MKSRLKMESYFYILNAAACKQLTFEINELVIENQGTTKDLPFTIRKRVTKKKRFNLCRYIIEEHRCNVSI